MTTSEPSVSQSEDLSQPPVDPVVARAQRRTVSVLSAGAVLGGIAVAGSIPAGSLLTATIADSEAVAGLAQTSGVIGAALMALPLARIALSRGRRAALSTGYGIGALGGVIVIIAAVTIITCADIKVFL